MFVISIPHYLYSQSISGKIENNFGEKIPMANVIIKDSINSGRIKEFVIAKNGQYSISLKGSYQKIIIEVSANKYIKGFFEIENPANSKSYTANFILYKDENIQLKEVTVTTKAKSFIVKDDTVKYNVAAYKDGSERKIEDIIKKLPGIEVNETTGVISYKGKSVETVKLEGDDLFGSNYTVGTKNINVDMIEQVQAIENYSDNPLLKGIESGDKVALNLKLKKEKLNFSGDMDFGSGVSDGAKLMYNAGLNILGISKKYKSFGTLSYNTIGINNSPFDYFSYNQGAEQIEKVDFLAKKIIPESFYASSLDDRRANLNNAWFGNYNNVFKIGNRSSIKTNLYYIHDRINSIQQSGSNNFINNRQILTSDYYSIEKSPTQYRGDVEIKYNSSKNSLVEYKFRLSGESINTSTNVLQNNTSNYQTELKTKDFKLRQSLLFTQKITGKKALQLFFNHSSNDIAQNYFLNPSVADPLVYSTDNQYSNFRNAYVSVRSVLLGSTEKTKYTFSIGSNAEKNPFQSRLTSKKNGITHINNLFTNDFTYKKYTLYSEGSFHLNLRKWKISPSCSLTYLQQNLTNKIVIQNTKKENIIFEPAFTLKYKFNNVSAVLGTISYNQKPLSEEYLFTKPIYISNRTIVKNEPGLELQQITSFGIFYLINNLYKQFQFNLSANYNRGRGNFFPNIFILENSTQVVYFYLPKSNENINFDFLIEKYMPVLESTIRLKSNYSISIYKNIVNNSNLRNNKNQFFSSELFMKTAFDIPINFENVVQNKKVQSQSENSKSFKNETINNTFKIIVKSAKNWFILLSADYFLPNTKKTDEDYLFLDAALRFTPKRKKFEVNFIAKNILNNKNFRQIETTDFSINNFQSNLLPGYLMLNISYNF
ncbi:MAG: hypothetical protein H7Z13_21160 [Ferruginibacter sp.]|nr:hypothetical protein [Ferruginibacter sp.]